MKYYLTTPLYYVNSKPHIGHSYTEIAADVLARSMRLAGYEVKFLTGTDEHGQKIDKAAQAAGMNPAEFTDKISLTFRDLWKTLNISEDDFIRTTEPRHKQSVKKVWMELHRKGEIYTAVYSGYYCTPCETFLTEETVRGLAAGAQEIACPDCGRPPEKIEETNYFFRLSRYQDWLAAKIETGDELSILPQSRRNEVLGFLRSNKLQDLCVSRPKSRLAWGIECPLSPDHVTYVWFDALINYISACGYGDDRQWSDQRWWPADVHIIGKDILRHHAIYWPILLHALGLKLPKLIFAHGWWVQDGEKMSKSRGNVTDPEAIVKKYGVDPYRYFLLRETPFGSDGTFSEEALVSRYNTDLANDLGNLLSRTLTMCEKYFEGRVPDIRVLTNLPESSIVQDVRDLKAKAYRAQENIGRSMKVLAFSEALAEIWGVVTAANQFIEVKAPWTLFKEGKQSELGYVILGLAEILRFLVREISPFMPSKAKEMSDQLGIEIPIEQIEKQAMSGAYPMSGMKISKGAPLFPKAEIKKDL
jgi:methionyl-tRNA synthetase